MHFSVEKSGKEVGSAQRFSHLKCIEFITYSQTTTATPAPPIATLAPYLFPGEPRFPACSRVVVSIPPPFRHFTLSTRRGIRRWWNAISNTEEWKVEGIPLSITFHRFRIESCFIAPCYGSFLRPRPNVYSRCCSTSRETFLEVQVREIFTYYLYVIIARIDIFWKCNARYGEKYVLRWWYTLLWISYISFRL